MSKHFELMQQMDRDPIADPEEASEFAFEVQRSKSRHSKLTKWADDEALRLVQQIFIVQTAPKVVVFSGVDHGNGCSRICASVAETLARNAQRPVCLVEANFRSPSLLKLTGTASFHGFTDALLQKGKIDSFAKPLRQNNLWLLPAGSVSSNSPSLLTSERLQDRMIELRDAFDFVIIDAPPLNQYSDAIALGQVSDGLVLILEAESTRRETASVVAANLRSMRIPILAAVLNKRKYPIPEAIYTRI